MKSLTLQIASVSDRENIVAEIWFGNDQVAEIFCEDGETTEIEIFPAPSSGVWTFDLDAFQEILTEAKRNL